MIHASVDHTLFNHSFEREQPSDEISYFMQHSSEETNTIGVGGKGRIGPGGRKNPPDIIFHLFFETKVDKSISGRKRRTRLRFLIF